MSLYKHLRGHCTQHFESILAFTRCQFIRIILLQVAFFITNFILLPNSFLDSELKAEIIGLSKMDACTKSQPNGQTTRQLEDKGGRQTKLKRSEVDELLLPKNLFSQQPPFVCSLSLQQLSQIALCRK